MPPVAQLWCPSGPAPRCAGSPPLNAALAQRSDAALWPARSDARGGGARAKELAGARRLGVGHLDPVELEARHRRVQRHRPCRHAQPEAAEARCARASARVCVAAD
eukprot:995565-Prymnesium_polylepis.2